MRIVVVGATGTIGQPLVAAARTRGLDVISGARHSSRGDIVVYDLCDAPISALVPDLNREDFVFLLAAVSSPGECYANPARARRVNVEATAERLSEIARIGAGALLMSTDQVFDGRTGGYDEASTLTPSNCYGRTKAEGEQIALTASDKFYVARTGWNVGWDTSERCPVRQCYATLLRPNARMASDNAINVTDVNDTVAALLAIAERRPDERVLHIVSDAPVWRSQMAQAIVEGSRRGGRMAFEPVPFAAIPYSEPRPRLAWMRTRHPDLLGVRFASPGDVIDRKVALLDLDPRFD
jgi:dTDP-4-dehydrorhamnose reductase